jgi:hypothetical protein
MSNIIPFPANKQRLHAHKPMAAPSPALMAALDAVSIVHHHGWVVVPLVPNDAMIAAGQGVLLLDAKTVQQIWDAMLQAW